MDQNRNGLYLDPEKDKKAIEEKIVERIEELLPHSDHDAVVNVVETKYEELLSCAKVKMHIPTLVEKLARDTVRLQFGSDNPERTVEGRLVQA